MKSKSKGKEVKQKQTGKNYNKILNKKIQIVIMKKGIITAFFARKGKE